MSHTLYGGGTSSKCFRTKLYSGANLKQLGTSPGRFSSRQQRMSHVSHGVLDDELKTKLPIDKYFVPQMPYGKGGAYEDLFQHYFRRRIIFVSQPVDFQSTNQLVAALLALELQAPDEDIKLYVNCPGGQSYCMLGLIDVLDSLNCGLQTVAFGHVQGHGNLIVSHGDKGKRLCMENTTFTLKQPQGVQGGHYADAKIIAEESITLTQTLRALYSTTTNLTMRELSDLTFHKDYQFPVKEALEFGIVDGILPRLADIAP